jgi:molybdopterin converting factor subunit 1
MDITVQLFASYAEAMGTRIKTVTLPEGATVGKLLDLIATLPGGSALPPNPLVAVNLTYAKRDAVLSARDEVALIPPVAGG